MSTFSSRLKEAINMRGITQKRLAEDARTTEATISRYIKEVNSPAVLEILSSMAIALNVSSDYLLGITNIPNEKASLTTEESILINCFDKATEDDRAVVWAVFNKYLSAKEKKELTEYTVNKKASVG